MPRASNSASSLDYRSTLATVAQFAVPQIADWCGVDLLEADGEAPQQVAVAHVDPHKVRWARELGSRVGADRAVEGARPHARRDAKGVHLQANVDHSFTIKADGDRLQQVVWNLLANAVKFTPKGGVVTIHAYREGSSVSICVVNTGEGIAADVLPYIFDPFRQADASTTRRHGGLGLGLAIVKQLVAAHGGTIHANSEGPGKGSQFVVTLPARGAVPSVATAARSTAAPTIEADVTKPVAPRLDGLSILVVDDEEDARGIIGHVLQSQGATVTSVASASEALDVLTMTMKPDVIVSDIGMPETDGYAFIRRVRALPVTRGARTPAVALTAYARKEDRPTRVRRGLSNARLETHRAGAARSHRCEPGGIEPRRCLGAGARVNANATGALARTKGSRRHGRWSSSRRLSEPHVLGTARAGVPNRWGYGPRPVLQRAHDRSHDRDPISEQQLGVIEVG
jgi:CheY-like chemotaxis protein